MKRCFAFILSLSALVLCACSAGKTDIPQPTEIPAATSAPTAAPSQSGSGIETIALFKDIHYYEYSEDDRLFCRVEYPVLQMSSVSHNQALGSSVDAFNAALAAQASETYTRLLNSARADVELNVENPGGYYSRTDLYVTRADSLALSALCVNESGAASRLSQRGYSSINLDSRTGRQLALRDVSTDAERLTALIGEQLEKDYPKAKFYDLEAAMGQYAQDISALVWTLDYQGLSFYFAPYELAPYEEGSFCVGLRFDDHPELFSIYYTRQPFSYAVPVVEGRCLNYDMDSDGVSDFISLSRQEKKGVNYLVIGVNSSELSINVSMTGYEAYVVYAGPSRSYLYINAHNSSDYGYISVYRLERTGAALLGMLYDTSLQAAGYTPECPGIPLLTKPEQLILGTKVELLGTLTGVKDYSIGSAGMPETADEYYRVYADTTLTAKGDFATAAIDPVTGRGLNTAVKIAAGTRMYYYHSDGAGYVDLMSEDGQCCRMYVSGRGQAQTVNGMPVDQCFDGLIYK